MNSSRTAIMVIAANFVLAGLTSTSAADTDSVGKLVHVRLKNRLDRPDDGYCFDILGTGNNLRLNLPLFAHNCKGGVTPDSAVTYSVEGQLIFPAPNVCVTAFGVNNTVLSNTPLLLRPCNERTAFFETSELQKFNYTNSGQLRLRGSSLCVTVGLESSETYSPLDRWRSLFLATCAEAAPSRSVWELVRLK